MCVSLPVALSCHQAVETLEVNQTLNELCIGLLESVLLKFRSAGDKNAVHAMLITGAKLLALYSR